MPRFPDDRLLQVTRLVLTVLMGLTIFSAVAALATLPILYFKYDLVVAEFAKVGIRAESIPRVVALMLGGVVLSVLAFFFLRHLRRIVDSVSHGDPFVPINADRLRHMAWLALAMQAVMVPVMGLLVWWDALPDKANVHYSDNNWFGGLMLALLLFVLARVFRVGAAMREELEGTV